MKSRSPAPVSSSRLKGALNCPRLQHQRVGHAVMQLGVQDGGGGGEVGLQGVAVAAVQLNRELEPEVGDAEPVDPGAPGFVLIVAHDLQQGAEAERLALESLCQLGEQRVLRRQRAGETHQPGEQHHDPAVHVPSPDTCSMRKVGAR